jgi:hypothetical protein
MSTAEAFFKVKPFTACKSRYDHNNTNLRPVDGHAHEVILSYDQKFKKLDSLFAADVVGDGTSEVVGPFEAAKKRFFKGTVIPICTGWFREVNKNYETLISTLAREAAAGDNGMRISPLVNSDRKGGAYQIMLQQFRRAIGVAIV